MKKRYNIAALALMISLSLSSVVMAATGSAYPEVPVSERTSNLAENQDFVETPKVVNGEWIRYNLYGSPLRNARLAGGIMTDDNGHLIWNGIPVDGVQNTYGEAATGMPKDRAWRQDPEKSVNENGISNWYYGLSTAPTNGWRWLSDEDNIYSTLKAYCFNEYGYLYVNTITPDGFIVNERGQMITEDGTLVEHEVNALTHDAMHSAYIGASIGFMKRDYFTVCIWPYNPEANYGCGGKCLFGYDK